MFIHPSSTVAILFFLPHYTLELMDYIPQSIPQNHSGNISAVGSGRTELSVEFILMQIESKGLKMSLLPVMFCDSEY